MRIAALEPYAALSHLQVLTGLQGRSRHEIELFTLPARGWKWRMRTASFHFARVLAEHAPFDLLFVSDYVNLAELIGLLPTAHRGTPALVYMHENQLTYPLQPGEPRDVHFALTHLHSMVTARRVLFNSHYHRNAFFEALAALLRHVPDVDLAATARDARERSGVLPLGTDAPAHAPREATDGGPVILWNHRWEYDKDPEALVKALVELVDDGEDFRLRLLGQGFRETPSALAMLRDRLGDRIVHHGFLPDRTAYLAALAASHVVLSTARHEFFGLSTLEALRAGCLPVLPNDLAYQELLPADESGAGRFLYPRADGPVSSLRTALEAVRTGRWRTEREALVRHTDRFTWDEVAPRFDQAFETAAV